MRRKPGLMNQFSFCYIFLSLSFIPFSKRRNGEPLNSAKVVEEMFWCCIRRMEGEPVVMEMRWKQDLKGGIMRRLELDY